MSSLSDALSASRAAELRRAARALLKRPLLRANGPDQDAFVLVRRYATALRAWFDRNTGWRLTVDSELARLVKTPGRETTTPGDHTHPARDTRTKAAFSRRRYVLACLAMSSLERAESQITLGGLAEQIVVEAADPELVSAGVEFTLENRDERSDLVSVVRLLLELGVLSRVAGDEDAFVKDAGDVLYDVERRVLATLLAATQGPSLISATGHPDRVAALSYELPPTTDDLRNQRIRHRLTRRLLDEPVLYYEDLDAAEAAYLSSQRAAIIRQISEFTGLIPELRAEGISMVDPTDDLTDVRMPDIGTEGHATLLLADYLAERTGRAVPLDELHEHLRLQAQRHRSYWRRNAAEPGAEKDLTAGALDRLEALRLVHRTATEVTARAALSRYALADPTVQEQL